MSDGATERPVTLDHLRSRKKALTTTVPVVVDGDVAEAWADAEAAIDAAKFARDQADERGVKGKALAALELALTEATAARDALRPEVEAATVEFKLRALGRRGFEDLVKEHPPSAAQIAEAKAEDLGLPTWNGDTFPQALVAACLMEPAATVEQVQALWDDPNWNAAELLSLWGAALSICQVRRVADLGKGSGPTRN